MAYDINIMPRNLEEWEILIAAKLTEEEARAEADSAYMPRTRQELEQIYSCYYPRQEEEYFEPEIALTEEQLFARLRAERNRRIAATDYLMFADYPIEAEARASVEAYRQALRDLPGLEGAPWDGGGQATPWPVEP